MNNPYYMNSETISAVEYLSRHFDVSPDEIIARGVEIIMALQQSRVQGYDKMVFRNEKGDMLNFNYKLG